MVYSKIELPFEVKKPILAMGAQAKNRLCYAVGNLAYLSPLHNSLADAEDFSAFEKDLKYFLKREPKIIAYDLHPEYQSTKYARRLSGGGFQVKGIQHHHAHIASCMLENGLKNRRVIGVAFDGTGLGTENGIWGAEFLLCDYKKFTRVAHLREIPLLGGEKAILEPWRVAAAWLYLIHKERFLDLDINFAKKIDRRKWMVLKGMYLSGFNSPLVSSMGRLFDAVASLVLVRYKVDFEAELAMELEKIGEKYTEAASPYTVRITPRQNKYLLDAIPMFQEIVTDLESAVCREKISYRFHLAIAETIKKACLALKKESKINQVILSGGVFQNKLLVRLSLDLLHKERFDVFTHRGPSCNDSGICLGQVAIAEAGGGF